MPHLHRIAREAWRVLAFAVLVASAAAYHSPAFGQWSVFDASNFAKNALTAAQTASQYAKQLDQYRTQIMQLQAQLQNLNQVPDSLWSSELGHELSAQAQGCSTIECVRAAAGQLSDVYGSAAQTAREGASLYNQSADFGWKLDKFSQASGMTPEQIFSYEQGRAQAGQQAAETQFYAAQHLQQQLGTWQQKADANARAAQNAQGARDALQALAAQSHLQTTQLSSLLKASSDANMAQAARDAQDAQEKAQEAQLYNEAQARMKSYRESAGITSGITVTP